MQSAAYLKTPTQPLGPFYPEFATQQNNQDLTHIEGNSSQAKGQIIIINGIVKDDRGQPLAMAQVEIWQACHSGRYGHPLDTSSSELDSNFQYYGKAKTNRHGEYSFKTILPGEYEAEEGWTRPPHIHFKITHKGYHELITQLYFAGHELNKDDQILQQLAQEEQEKIVIAFRHDERSNLLTGNFIINLKKL